MIFISCLFFVLPAFAIKEPSDAEFFDALGAVYGEFGRTVKEYADALRGGPASPSFSNPRTPVIRFVDDESGETEIVDLKYHEATPEYEIAGGVFGRLSLTDFDFETESRTITAWKYWQIKLAREVLLQMAKKGTVTLHLLKPSRIGYSWALKWSYSEYGLNRVKVQLNNEPAQYLGDLVKAYKKQQEERGRYVGPVANIRKAARNLLGLPTRTCQGLFVSVFAE